MSNPKVVVFDLGKVLLDFDYRVAAQKMAAVSDVSPRQIQDFIDHSPLLVRYEKGFINRMEFFQEVKTMSGYRDTFETFSATFADIFTPIAPMIALKQRLTAAGIPTCIFSNTNDLAIEHVRATYPFFNGFDGYVYSYEQGFMKPEAQLYQVVEAMTGQKGAAICYIDDRTENVDAGKQRGWTAVLHKTPMRQLGSRLV